MFKGFACLGNPRDWGPYYNGDPQWDYEVDDLPCKRLGAALHKD